MPPRLPEPAPTRVVRRRADLPGVDMIRLTFERELNRVIPLQYGTVLRLAGESEWSVGGEQWTTGPGTLGVKVPGELYVERSRRGPTAYQVLVFEDALVQEARDALDQPPEHPRASSFDGLRDPRVGPLMALHRCFDAQSFPDGAPSSVAAELEQTLSEALASFVTLTGVGPSRVERGAGHAAVARARALLDERITESVSLDELAAHARLNKFRLCRAFREQVGLPPHAYVTHRRVSLAQSLLARGMSQAEVAVRVGLYDQSQLHRHFKRISGITPGAYARALHPGPQVPSGGEG